MYSDELKSNYKIWESIPKIDLGGTGLRGLIIDKIEIEAKYYLRNSNDELVKKYLPGVFVSNEQESIEKLDDFVKRFLLRGSILFSLVDKASNVPAGYVLCHSPRLTYLGSEEKIGDWSIDFWMLEQARGRGIMTAAVYNVLAYLQEMEVPLVYAFTDKTNLASMRVLEKCNMKIIDETGDGKMYKYAVRLKPND
jgi:RimJ/RimL family protein N-acetyltransferase